LYTSWPLPTFFLVSVIMKPPFCTPAGRSGALTEAPGKSWLQSRLVKGQQQEEHKQIFVAMICCTVSWAQQALLQQLQAPM
jgi:hypothetical protein